MKCIITKGVVFINKVKLFFCTLALTILTLSFAISEADASSFRTVKVVNGSSLIVKESASPSAQTIASLSKGDFVTVFSTSNGWAYIQSGNIVGHVNASFLASPPSTIKIASSKSGLVVKASPSKSAPTSAGLKYNMIVVDYGTSGDGWSFVQYGNVTGYVASSFISKPKTLTKYVNTATGIVVRNIASSSGENIGSLANNTEVTVHSTLVGWSYITAGNISGYVVDKFLTNKKPSKVINGSTGAKKPVVIGMTYNDVYKNIPETILSKSNSEITTELTKYGYNAEVSYLFENNILTAIIYDFILAEDYHSWYEIYSIHDYLLTYATEDYGPPAITSTDYGKRSTLWQKNGYNILLNVNDDNLYTRAYIALVK